MGQIVASIGDLLTPRLPACLPIFYDRLKNEITRLVSVKALVKIASSPLAIDLKSTILEPSLAVLATLLRKNQRALKLSTLTLLNILVKNYSSAMTANSLGVVLKVKNNIPLQLLWMHACNF